ncbi:hypothetical protein L0F63_001560 [Massospora cicadina]|nr:hypothetical protein L0F63_001560 [Massospora cicadina]
MGIVLGCGPSSLTTAKLETAMPSCGRAKAGAEGENISCSRALPYIQRALNQYNLVTPEQMAFYISVISVETANLSYNRNHFPGRPGQGTRSMMMPDNLHVFFKSSPKILKDHPELTQIAEKSTKDMSNVDKEKLLNVLMQDEYSFLPGAWWISEGGEKLMKPNCNHFKSKLTQGASKSTIDDLNTNCLGVGEDPTRFMAYRRALKAVKCC